MNPEQARQHIEDQTDEHSDLAQDIDRSIEVLFSEIEFSSGTNPAGIDPAMALSVLRPMIQTKADTDREQIVRALAIIHLETGALLERHTDKDPVEFA